MPRSYCSSNDVKAYLPPNVVVEGENEFPDPFNPDPASVLIVDIQFYIQQVCDIIDASLGTIYDVPFKQVNQGGVVTYPRPINQIAALLSSEMIWEQRLQGADRQRSESVKERIKWAHDSLNAIQNGEMRLVGQRATIGSRFINGKLPNIPRNPAEGGRTKGSGS